jgi:hypothetical protein
MERVCVKVASLRRRGYSNLQHWLSNPQNVYVGRYGRIFISQPDGEKKIFHYSQSIWANPYKVGDEYTREQALYLYEKHLYDSSLINSLHLLHGRSLGCFCDENEACHVDILLKLIRQQQPSQVDFFQ